jgi:hypothetical protein
MVKTVGNLVRAVRRVDRDPLVQASHLPAVVNTDVRPFGVSVPDRIPVGVGIRVDTRQQPDGIGLDVLAGSRVIVSEPVVVKPGLPVEDLSREAQVVGKLRFRAPGIEPIERR